MVNVDRMTKEMVVSLPFSEDGKTALAEVRKESIVFDIDFPEITLEKVLKFRLVTLAKGRMEKRAQKGTYFFGVRPCQW